MQMVLLKATRPSIKQAQQSRDKLLDKHESINRDNPVRAKVKRDR